MARLFRFVQKKRGERRTGSHVVGIVGEALFCGALFSLGTLLLSVIVGTHLVAPDPARFALGVGGWLLVLVTASSVVLGGGGLIWAVLRMGTSVERRSALARRASEIEIVRDAARPRNYPTVPPCDGLTNSPGIELAYRLPPSQTPGWRLLVVTIFAMLWNFVVCLLTVSMISGAITGRHSWLLAVLILPLWGVCYWSIRAFLQLVVTSSGMGQTTVEVSELPLTPGQPCQVVISQHGQAKMKSLELSLACEEEATFTQGTDIRTEVREVYRQVCLARREFSIDPGMPFTDNCLITVPPRAMHSFQAAHHMIRWKLVVCGEAEGWPPFERGFPLVVHPGEATMHAETTNAPAWQPVKPTIALPAAAGARA